MKSIVLMLVLAFCSTVHSECCGSIFQASNYLMKEKKFCGDLAALDPDWIGALGVSSVKMDPGCFMQAFKQPNFAGESKMYTANTPLVDWNDLIQSIKFKQCCGSIFQAMNYGLKEKQFCTELPALDADWTGPLGVSSLKVDAGCVMDVFKQPSFAGETKTYAENTPLTDWNDVIKSLKARLA